MEDLLAKADQALFDGDPAAALKCLSAIPDGPVRGPFHSALVTVAEVLLEATVTPEAAAKIIAVADAGLPLPGILLACGRILRRFPRQLDRAARCYVLLDQLGHPSLAEFCSGLPADQRLRFLPLIRRAAETLRQPNDLLLLAGLKQGLRKLLPMEELASVYARSLGLDPIAPRWLTIEGLEENVHRTDALKIEVFPPQTFSLARPRVPGRPHEYTETLEGRRMFVARICDVCVHGSSSMIVQNDRAIFDCSATERSRIEPLFVFDPLIVAQRKESVLVTTAPERTGMVFEEAFSLLGSTSGVFGHWLAEYLPRVCALLTHDCCNGQPILVDERMPSTHRQSLELLVGGRNPIVVVPMLVRVRVERLWVCSNAMYVPIHPRAGQNLDYRYLSPPPDALARLFSVVNEKVDSALAPRRSDRRLFFARKPSQHRKLLNSASVEARFAAAGFERVQPESLRFDEQVSLVREASHIVGPEGSGLFLGAFAREGTRLCMLNHSFIENLPTVSGVIEACGVEVSILCGRTIREDRLAVRFSDYEIDDAQIDALLADWQLLPETVAETRSDKGEGV